MFRRQECLPSDYFKHKKEGRSAEQPSFLISL
jgi:hypothetical protein